MEKWKARANKEVTSIAKKAERKKIVTDNKKKEHTQKSINNLIGSKIKGTRAERRAERSVLR